MASRPSLQVAAAALGVALVLGVGAAALASQGDPDGASATSSSPDFGPDGPGPSDKPDPALSGEPVPTLPPGDPGTGSPEPDETTGSEEPGESHGHDAVTEVPESALVDAQTVGDLAGGSWTVDPADGEACATGAAAGSTASRTVSYASADGHLVQTVSAHESKAAAKAGVTASGDRLAACGFTPVGDPRLGDASVQLTRTSADGGEEVAVVIAADGVSVLLVTRGSAAAQGVWESLADLAMGTSCAAAHDPCH
jgi:hypothetical protein